MLPHQPSQTEDGRSKETPALKRRIARTRETRLARVSVLSRLQFCRASNVSAQPAGDEGAWFLAPPSPESVNFWRKTTFQHHAENPVFICAADHVLVIAWRGQAARRQKPLEELALGAGLARMDG